MLMAWIFSGSDAGIHIGSGLSICNAGLLVAITKLAVPSIENAHGPPAALIWDAYYFRVSSPKTIQQEKVDRGRNGADGSDDAFRLGIPRLQVLPDWQFAGLRLGQDLNWWPPWRHRVQTAQTLRAAG